MKTIVVLSIALLLLWVPFVFANCRDDKVWAGSLILHDKVKYSVDYLVENNQVILRLKARNHGGFLGFGISEAGHMLGADIAVLTMNEVGVPNVQDYFVPWTAAPNISPHPIVDACNDWTMICGTNDGRGYQEFVVSRALDTNDTQDRAIVHGLNTIIFAWGIGPEETSLTYHGPNRGTVSISFFNDENPAFIPPPDADGSATLLFNNFMLRPKRTTYALQKFDLGEAETHIVAYEPLVNEADKPFVHHFLLHECGDDRLASPLNYLPLHFPRDLGKSLIVFYYFKT